MIYQFFLISNEEILVKWSKEEGLEASERKRRKILNEKNIIQLSTLLAPETKQLAFNEINFDKFTLSFLFSKENSYIIISDEEDSTKAKNNFLIEVHKELAPTLDKLREGKELANLDEFMEDKLNQHTRILAGPRSSSFGSLVTGFIGGILFFVGFSWMSNVFPLLLPSSSSFTETFYDILSRKITLFLPLWSHEWWSILLFISILTLFTAFFAGLFAGKGIGGAFGSYLAFMLLFSMPILFATCIPSSVKSFLETYVSLVSSIPLIYQKFRTSLTHSWQILFTIGTSFGLVTALLGGMISGIIDKRSLTSMQIKTKREKSYRKRETKAGTIDSVKEEELGAIKEKPLPEEEEVEIEDDELEELEELFKEK